MKSQRSEYWREYREKNWDQIYKKSRQRIAGRQRFLDAVKRTAGCIDCGYNELAVALDFDHVRNEKAYNVANIRSYPWAKLVEELMKCDVRCANCHRIVTQERQMERIYG